MSSANARVRTGVELISAERRRQVKHEGYDASHDAIHGDGDLSSAAICYAEWPYLRGYALSAGAPPLWPFDVQEWKPSGDRVRDLVKAGALLAAEIDRLLIAGRCEAERARRLEVALAKPDGECTGQDKIVILSAIGGPDVLDFSRLDAWSENECAAALRWCANSAAEASDNVVSRRKGQGRKPEFCEGVLR